MNYIIFNKISADKITRILLHNHALHYVVSALKGCVLYMSEILEVTMIVCFGASWPFNVIKSYKARTAKGKSPMFLILIISGYIGGIISKLLNTAYMASFASIWYVLFFYVLNLIMVSIDLCLYIRNRRLDKAAAVKKKLI